MKNKDFYIVIMAGGTGTRLWPVSRRDMPKQFQKFTSAKTMIQETYQRVAKVAAPQNIYVSTAERYKNLVLEQLPKISKQQLIIEPMPRGTAPAITLVAQTLHKINPHAVVATIASDHAIKNPEEFVVSVSAALAAAQKHPDKLVTVGINPTSPDTGLGYIKMGKESDKFGQKKVFHIDSFVEKPDLKMAEKYLRSWQYLWNAGYFIFSAKGFLDIAEKLIPKTKRSLEKMSVGNKKKAESIYGQVTNEPIDTAIAEKLEARLRLVVPSEMDWSDVGNWGSLHDFFKNGSESTMIVRGKHIDEGSRDLLVHAKEKLVATVGLNEVIIIETDDAILVAHKNKVAEVKKIIDKLKKQGKHLYL